MHFLDWLLLAIPLTIAGGFAIYTRRFVKSVADFLSAGRCAGRYLLANARGESDAGLANTMAKFEIVLVSGFVLNFWEKLSVPVALLVGITGFVVYRFRETRAMTLAQFLEMRYSRRFRLFMGMLAFVSGILNYGIFPAISARFFIYFLHLPTSVDLGLAHVPTFALIMFSYLSLTVLMTTVGGQVTLMVADCIEGIMSHLIYIVIIIAVFAVVKWHEIIEVMAAAAPGKSHIDPFNAYEIEDFNIWYIAIAMCMSVYVTMAFQGKQGFNAAARTPHESRMGGVLGNWRSYARILMILMLGICAVTYLQHPDFADSAKVINGEIHEISDPYLQKQMTVPIALSHLLPVGVKGLFCAMMVMGLFAGDSGHMHSWGSILVQDVILPLRKAPFSPRQHIWALRAAITFVAAFAFCFSLLFQQTQYISLWWALTGGVFVGGAGAAIIGGLYWTRGTTAGAWSAQITGSVFTLVGILLTNRISWGWITEQILRPSFPGVMFPTTFWFNGAQILFFAACAAVFVYVVVSLTTCKQAYNLDKLLHRGKFALLGEMGGLKPVISLRERLRIKNILRFDENFSFSDKLISAGIFWWAILLLTVNVIVSIWNLAFFHWPIEWWSRYWLVTAVGFPFLIALATLVWFGIGGIRDMRDFFTALRTMSRDSTDDGRVPTTGESTSQAGSAISTSLQPVPNGVPLESKRVMTPSLSSGPATS